MARKPDIRAVRSRARIIEAAGELFLAKGYDISLDEVAAQAGVVKRTLYNIFENKLSLLLAVLEAQHETYRNMAEPYAGSDLTEMLAHYARLYRHHTLTDRGVKFYRLIIGDVSQFPPIAREVYDTGMGYVIASLGDQLQAGIDGGWIRPVDTRQMAERFYSALVGLSQRRVVCGLGQDPPAFQKRYLDDTVAMFAEVLAPR